MLVVGVDGWKKGWVAIQLRDGRFDSAFAAERLGDVLNRFADARTVGIDIPIGFPPPFPRRADASARRFLCRGASSVFTTFPETVYEAGSHAEAVAIATALCGSGVSQQSWRLGPRILEVARLDDRRLTEVHPECSFRTLGKDSFAGKKTWTGQAQRRRALASAGVVIPDALADAGLAPADDVLDAAVAAWSAARVAAGLHATFPSDPGPGEPRISC